MNKRNDTPSIGVGISTTPNRKLIEHTLEEWKKRLPENAEIFVQEDSEFLGISVTKNALLSKLQGFDHIFLADDDTWPIADDWWVPYVGSKEPHLQYNFTRGANHWPIKVVSKRDGTVAYDRSRGCILYAERRVLEVVGGMHNVFGKHGREHEDWSERIFKAGLTTNAFQDVEGKKFYCMDEDKEGISSVDYSLSNGWKHIETEYLPLYADYQDRKIPVLVARRNDNGYRDRIWRFLKSRYWHWNWHGLEIIEGHQSGGPFNRSAGLNLAAEIAANWDVAIFIDSDSYVSREAINRAVSVARETQKAVSPFTAVVELTKEATEQILLSRELEYDPETWQIDRIRTEPIQTQSLFLVVPRNLYERVGGFDEKFVGWGGEDNAFWKSLEIHSGEVIRLEGNAYHLWHPQASRAYQPKNGIRFRRYQRAYCVEDLKAIRKS